MFSDPRFYKMLSELTPGSHTVSFDVSSGGDRVEWTQTIVLPDSVPASLRSMIGPSMTLVETQLWGGTDGEHRAAVRIAPVGLPAHCDATYIIRPPAIDGLCLVAVSASIAVAVPIVGAKVEAIISEHFQSAVNARSRAAQMWPND